MISISGPAETSWLRRLAPYIIFILIVLLLSVIAWKFALHSLYDQIIVWLSMEFPINPKYITLVSDLIIGSLLFAVLPGFLLKSFFFGLPKPAIKVVYLLVPISIVVWDLTLGRDVFFNKNGEPQQFYIIRADEGLVVTSFQAPDPVTGETPQPIDREIVPSIRAMYKKNPPTALNPTNVDETHLFDASTGRSLIWYYKDPNGTYRLYNGPGFDPESQVPLRPVTKNFAHSVQDYILKEKAALAERNRKAALEAEKRRQTEARLRAEQLARDKERQRAEEKARQDKEDRGIVERARVSISKGNRLSAKNDLEDLMKRRPSFKEARDIYDGYSLSNACKGCGTYESVTKREIKGTSSGTGAIIGAAGGAVAGHQTGKGRGQDVATGLGAVLMGFVGDKLERRIRSSTVYDLHFIMDDGTNRIVTVKDDTKYSQGKRFKIISSNGRYQLLPIDNRYANTK